MMTKNFQTNTLLMDKMIYKKDFNNKKIQHLSLNTYKYIQMETVSLLHLFNNILFTKSFLSKI